MNPTRRLPPFSVQKNTVTRGKLDFLSGKTRQPARLVSFPPRKKSPTGDYRDFLVGKKAQPASCRHFPGRKSAQPAGWAIFPDKKSSQPTVFPGAANLIKRQLMGRGAEPGKAELPLCRD